MSERIVLATPHRRHDALERSLRQLGMDVMRVRDRDGLDASALRQFDPSHVFFPHWSWKIPASIFEAFECVIFHMTDVPFGRGGSPLQNLVVRGIRDTCLTALRCVEQMDAGPTYGKRNLSTLGTAEEVYLRMLPLLEEMIVQIVRERPMPQEQVGPAVIFRRRTPADGNIETAASLEDVHDLIRMLDADGYPPAFIQLGPLRLEFSRASLRDGHVDADVRITFSQDLK